MNIHIHAVNAPYAAACLIFITPPMDLFDWVWYLVRWWLVNLFTVQRRAFSVPRFSNIAEIGSAIPLGDAQAWEIAMWKGLLRRFSRTYGMPRFRINMLSSMHSSFR